MLTKIIIRRFKRFEEVEVPLGDGFVFVGPNNSGKTSALEALALWYAGLQQWLSRREPKNGGGKASARRYGLTINRKSLVLVPIPHSSLLWHNRKLRRANNINHLIELIVHGEDVKGNWECGLEFQYSSPEAFYCRPLRKDEVGDKRMKIPEQMKTLNLALLPPMSGLAAEEPLIQSGRINVLLGQGRTSEVLRNICYAVYEKDKEKWNDLVKQIESLFGMHLETPIFRPVTGDIVTNYKEKDATGKNITLDLQSAGRGVQQVILLVAFLYYHDSGTVLLLDEPDAHLEILRQGEIYRLLNDIAAREGSQIIAASHSEKLLNVAGENGTVVSFVGRPHLMAEGKKKEVRKALAEIGRDHYHQAEMRGWVLYLEGETDLRILSAFAEKLQHGAKEHLTRSFHHYMGTDNPNGARRHFTGLMEAFPALLGVLVMDHKPNSKPPEGLRETGWKRHEIENYLCVKEALLDYAESQSDNVGGVATRGTRSIFGGPYYREKMSEEIDKMQTALKHLHEPGLFSGESHASKNLESLMENFTKSSKTRSLVKKDFYKLVQFIPENHIDPELEEKLDFILGVAEKARRNVAR